MAGKKGRSGGSKGRTKADGSKGRGAFAPALPTATAPALGNTVRSVQRHARWVASQLLTGTLDTATAQRVSDCHRTILLGDRQTFQRRELDELRALVKRHEQASLRIRQVEIAAGKNGGSEIAEYDAGPDDVPVERKPS